MTELPEGPLYWTLELYPSRESAAAAAGATGLVVEVEQRIWLLTVGPSRRPSRNVVRIADIGPLPIEPASAYEIVAGYGILSPGADLPVHSNSGPEAWYVLAGAQCLELPGSARHARAGESMIAAGDTPMKLVVLGHTARRALFVVVHDASRPWNTAVDSWQPIGSCTRHR
ncbi:MAG: hypothetical protein NVS4B3_08060 [Gemmatimonadaceae bacterium]